MIEPFVNIAIESGRVRVDAVAAKTVDKAEQTSFELIQELPRPGALPITRHIYCIARGPMAASTLQRCKENCLVLVHGELVSPGTVHMRVMVQRYQVLEG